MKPTTLDHADSIAAFLQDGLLGEGELGTDLSAAHLTELVSDLDGLVNVLSSGQGAEETSGEHVTGAVGVDNLVAGELGDGVDLGVGVGRLDVGGRGRGGGGGDEGRVGTLGDDDESRSRGVRLGERGEGRSDALERGVTVSSGRGVRGGLALVSDQNVDVGEERLELHLEELGDEGSRQVQDDSLAMGASTLGDLESRLDAVGQEVTLDVEVLGPVEELGNLGLGEVVRGELLGGSEGRHERSVVVRDKHGTGARLGRGRLDLVGGLDVLGVVGGLERLFQVVVSDRTNVRDRASGEDVLNVSKGIAATSDCRASSRS